MREWYKDYGGCGACLEAQARCLDCVVKYENIRERRVQHGLTESERRAYQYIIDLGEPEPWEAIYWEAEARWSVHAPFVLPPTMVHDMVDAIPSFAERAIYWCKVRA